MQHVTKEQFYIEIDGGKQFSVRDLSGDRQISFELEPFGSIEIRGNLETLPDALRNSDTVFLIHDLELSDRKKMTIRHPEFNLRLVQT